VAKATAVCNWIQGAPAKSIENFYFYGFFFLFAKPDEEFYSF
jgi:hypothetical protein